MDCASDKIVSFEFVLGRQLTRENSLGSKKIEWSFGRRDFGGGFSSPIH